MKTFVRACCLQPALLLLTTLVTYSGHAQTAATPPALACMLPIPRSPANGESTMCLFGLAAPGNAGPNVKCTGFSALRDHEKILLQWCASMEKDLDHFVLQRSTDGKQFRDIALVFTGELSAAVCHYAYKDRDVALCAPLLYYRLQMADRSGAISYSPMCMVREVQEDLPALDASPEPVAAGSRLAPPRRKSGLPCRKRTGCTAQ